MNLFKRLFAPGKGSPVRGYYVEWILNQRDYKGIRSPANWMNVDFNHEQGVTSSFPTLTSTAFCVAFKIPEEFKYKDCLLSIHSGACHPWQQSTQRMDYRDDNIISYANAVVCRDSIVQYIGCGKPGTLNTVKLSMNGSDGKTWFSVPLNLTYWANTVSLRYNSKEVWAEKTNVWDVQVNYAVHSDGFINSCANYDALFKDNVAMINTVYFQNNDTDVLQTEYHALDTPTNTKYAITNFKPKDTSQIYPVQWAKSFWFPTIGFELVKRDS